MGSKFRGLASLYMYVFVKFLEARLGNCTYTLLQHVEALYV